MEQEVTPFGGVETATPAAKSDFERLWTAAELLRTDFPDVKYIAPGLLPEGLALLGGRAKLGKSWLALQLACAVGSGGRMFDLQVEQRQVLYLALEDGPRRIKKRMKLQQWPTLENVSFGYEAAPDRLGRMVDETGCQLLIIDTFSRFFNLDQQDVQPVTNALGKLQRFAGERDITILVIDHHNKAGTGDPIQDLLGSTGKGASADTVWGLYRDRGQRDACLKVVGRDMEDADLRLAWDPELHCWQLVADDAPGKHDAAIFAALKEGPAGVSELARRMKVSKGVLPETLARLVNRGLLNVDPATKRYSRNE